MKPCPDCDRKHNPYRSCETLRSTRKDKWDPPTGLQSPKLPAGFCTCGHQIKGHSDHGNQICEMSVWRKENAGLLVGVCDCEGYRLPGEKPWFEHEDNRADCACHTCRQQRADNNRKKRDKLYAQRKAQPHKVPHGTHGGYVNWGCRCYLCREARARYRRKPQER